MAKIVPLSKAGKGQQKGKAKQQPIKKASQPAKKVPQQQQQMQQRMPHKQQKGQHNGGVDPWKLLAALGINKGALQGVQKQSQQKVKPGAVKQKQLQPTAKAGAVKQKQLQPKAKAGAGPKAPSKPPPSKFAERLKAHDADKKVWVGGLPKDATWKQVVDHFEAVKKPKFGDVVVKRDGTAVATLAYESADDVASVVASLNGSDLRGKTLEVDTWQMPDRSERREKRKGKKQGKQNVASNLKKVLNTKMVKSVQEKKKPAVDPEILEKVKGIDASLKVWVGGLSEKTTWQALRKHFSTVAKPKLVALMKKGRGVVCMSSKDDVSAAIGALNGSELDGSTLEVDVWTTTQT